MSFLPNHEYSSRSSKSDSWKNIHSYAMYCWLLDQTGDHSFSALLLLHMNNTPHVTKQRNALMTTGMTKPFRICRTRKIISHRQPNGWRYPLVGGTRQRHFDGIHCKPRKLSQNAPTPTSRVHAVLGGGVWGWKISNVIFSVSRILLDIFP